MVIGAVNRFFWDFAGSPVVKNPHSSAEHVGSIPGWRTKIPRALEQLGPPTTTTEPAPRCRSLCTTVREARTLQQGRSVQKRRTTKTKTTHTEQVLLCCFKCSEAFESCSGEVGAWRLTPTLQVMVIPSGQSRG